MDAAGRRLLGAMETVIREKFGVKRLQIAFEFRSNTHPNLRMAQRSRISFSTASGRNSPRSLDGDARAPVHGPEPAIASVFAFLTGFRRSNLAGRCLQWVGNRQGLLRFGGGSIRGEEEVKNHYEQRYKYYYNDDLYNTENRPGNN